MTGYAYTAADTYATNNSHITFNPLYEAITNTSTISKTAITLGQSITINFSSTGGKRPMTYAAMYSLDGEGLKLKAQADDIKAVAFPALRHRIIPGFEAMADGVKVDEIIANIIASVPMG